MQQHPTSNFQLPTYILAFLSGILLWASWPPLPFTFLIFIAWIPLLIVESRVKQTKRFFALTYFTMFTWNVSTTWWIINASVPGALAAFFANSFLMCLPWLLYRICKRRLGTTKGYISLIILWMCFEYIHLQDWGLSWPWLTLGNVFATHPGWIQWYEFTGTSGGTFWILLVNILLFNIIIKRKQLAKRSLIKHLAGTLLAIFIPFILSSIVNEKNRAGMKGSIRVL